MVAVSRKRSEVGVVGRRELLRSVTLDEGKAYLYFDG
jgi:hypothetical protein